MGERRKRRVVPVASFTSRYHGGNPSTAWLKVKCVQRQEFVVVGWRPLE